MVESCRTLIVVVIQAESLYQYGLAVQPSFPGIHNVLG